MKHMMLGALVLSSILGLAARDGRAGHDGTLAVVAAFDPSQGQLPESVTVDGDGNFYLSMSNTVMKLPPGGALELFAQLPIPAGSFALGVKFGPDGDLYVGSGGFDPSQDAAHVFRVTADGTVSELAHLDPAGFPNDLAFDRAGNVYVTDPFLGQIWKIDAAGTASVWLKDALLDGNPADPALLVHSFGVDGIAFDRTRQNLYVANIDQASVVRIPIDRAGNAGTPTVFVADARIRGNDGLAFDDVGNLYVAVNGQDAIARIAPDGAVSVLASGAPLDSPSAFVFGGPGDKKSLYVVSFAVLRAFGAKPGVPAPSLAVLPVAHGGLALP